MRIWSLNLKVISSQISIHKFKWASGHKRFIYKKNAEGLFYIQTLRFVELYLRSRTIEIKIYAYGE